MQGTGVIFRDTVTVSGCLLLRPLRLPAAWRHPVVRPDSDRQLLAQAFEGIVRTDADKTRLHEYKKRIEELDTATAQLKSLEAELADLSSVDWAKGLELPDSCKR